MGYERGSGRYYRDAGDQRSGGRYRDEYRDREDRERARRYSGPADYDDDRGFFDRAGDEVRSWFGDDEAERRRRWDERVRQREQERDDDDGGRYSGASGYGGGGGGFSDGYFRGAGMGETYGVGRGAGATSTFGLGAGAHHDGWGGADPNYSAWRRRQVQALDRDYAEYRRENQSRFEQEFGSWRSGRETQRSKLRQAQEKQEVVGSDGTHIGTVDHVRDDRILLTRTDKNAGGHHHSIPCSWIVDVDDKVHVNRTGAQAEAAWKDEESQGPHNLNRAFPGTY